MRTLLLAAAAGIAALAIPAASTAQTWSGHGGGSDSGHHDGDHHHRGDFRNVTSDEARLRGRSPDGAWGYYEGDYDANRGFDPDKWNDWWHDRPDRSFPRWVQNNQNCTPDRMWWSGSGWHC
jgi:hypothetical protein